MKNIYIFLIVICSCGAGYHETSSSCTYRVINSDIVTNIFNIDIFRSDTTSLKTIFNVQPTIKIFKEKGIYDDNEYLSYVFETPNTQIMFFSNNGLYIEHALITGNDVKLYKNVEIGMFKNDFCNQLDISRTQCDTIVITNEDQTLVLNFIFVQEYLELLEIVAED